MGTRQKLSAMIAIMALGASLVVATATTAGAQTQTIDIVIDSSAIQPDRFVVWAPEGETVRLATVDVPADLVGRECEGDYIDANNDSIHPGNDIVVSTGATSVRFPGVEDAPGSVNAASGTVVLGSTIAVDLIMGPDEIFSADAAVSVVCAEPPPTTTEAPPTTTEAPPATTEAPPVTVAPTTTVATQVAGVQESNPAVPVTATPSFTG